MGKQIVEGFYFEDAGMAVKAEKEAETIRYIRSKTNLSKVDAVYGIYMKLIENNVFSTEVGYMFLAELHRTLQESGGYKEEDLPKVYIGKSIKSGSGIEEQNHRTGKNSKENDLPESKINHSKQGEDNTEVLSEEEEARVIEAVRKRTKILNDTGKTQVRNIREMYYDKLKTYKLVIAVLALCIIGMLAMVYFSDGSPLRDAEQQVLDKYASWQESLQEQEGKLQEKQNELKEKEVELATWEKELEEKENQLSGK